MLIGSFNNCHIQWHLYILRLFFGNSEFELAIWVLCMLWLIHGSKTSYYLFLQQIQGREKPQHVQNMHFIIRKRAGGLPSCVQIHSELVLLISWSRMPLKLRFHFMEGTSFIFYWLSVCTCCDVRDWCNWSIDKICEDFC